MSPRSPIFRFVRAGLVAAIAIGMPCGASTAMAAQALYAGPSTNPASTRSAASAISVVPASSAVPAAASAVKSGPRWNELGAPQRKALAPLANDWDAIEARSKERWLDVAARFHRMSVDEQQRATQRMVEWSHMTVAQRTAARIRFQETRAVSKEEREARWKAYQALPEEKKRELAKRAALPASAASPGSVPVKRRAPPPVYTIQPKTNVVSAAVSPRAAAGSAPPTSQGSTPGSSPGRPGITATLLNQRAAPPLHQRDGQPKIAAGPNAVDRTTLLPRNLVHATSAAASAPAPR